MESFLSIRTHRCGELRKEHVGQDVTLHGWVHNCRDKSQVIFVVLRDRSGIVQVTIDETCAQELLLEARTLRLEYTVQVQGTVRARDEIAINKDMDTGEIEILANSLQVLSSTKALPFNIGDKGPEVSQEVRLKYRYLDFDNQLSKEPCVYATKQHSQREPIWTPWIFLRSKPPFSIAPHLKELEITSFLLESILESGLHFRKAHKYSSRF